MSKPTVGWIGPRRIGVAMVERVKNARCYLRVGDWIRSNAEPIGSARATFVLSSSGQADVGTCITTVSEVRKIEADLFGKDGALSATAMPGNHECVEAGNLSPACFDPELCCAVVEQVDE